MTQPTIDFELDMSGLPVSYSAIFQAVQGEINPQLEPNHPYAVSSNVLRVKALKGVSTIQVSTNYINKYEVVHQERIGGTSINTRHEFTGGGAHCPLSRRRSDTVHPHIINHAEQHRQLGTYHYEFQTGLMSAGVA